MQISTCQKITKNKSYIATEVHLVKMYLSFKVKVREKVKKMDRGPKVQHLRVCRCVCVETKPKTNKH